MHVQGHVLPAHVNPYDLIKKYVAESSPPNSLSDSHLSSDGGGDGKEKRNGGGGDFLIGSESEEFTESDDGGEDRVATKAAAVGLADHCVVARFNSFRISGQKIQIYSDCSADNGRSGNYSLSSSSSSSERDGDEEDNDADADDDDDDDDDEDDDGLEDRESSYDADVSLTESPRVSKFPPPLPPPFPPIDLAPPPCKPPRRKSSETELRPALQRPAEPALQLRIVDLASPAPGATSTPQRRTSTLPRPSSSRLSGDSHKLQLSRQTSSESSSQQRRGSLTSRSRSFAGGGGGSASSRESLLLFGISQNFSSEVMKELYGSKTSLFQHLDQEQRRKQRLSDPTVAAASGVVSLVDGDARAVPGLVPPSPPAVAAGSDLEVTERTGTSQILFFIQNIKKVGASVPHHTKPSPSFSSLVAVNKSAER